MGTNNMSKLSPKAKESIVRKALSCNGRPLKEIASEHNIGRSTLWKWMKEYKDNGIIGNQTDAKSGYNLTVIDKFNHIIATSSLDETALGVYCREKGIYSFQLTEWKKEFMSKDRTKISSLNAAEIKKLRAENKQLQQEIMRKDSALAEATALLILKKKASLIWGASEEG
jgi:transposase-like protein